MRYLICSTYVLKTVLPSDIKNIAWSNRFGTKKVHNRLVHNTCWSSGFLKIFFYFSSKSCKFWKKICAKKTSQRCFVWKSPEKSHFTTFTKNSNVQMRHFCWFSNTVCPQDDRLRSPVFGAKTPSVLQRLDFERSFQVCIKEFSRFKVERRLEGKRFFLIKIQKCPSRRCLLTSYASKQSRRKKLFFFLISFSWWVIRINLVS